jgi:hypothetical protein
VAGTPFTQQFLDEQRQILGEADYNQEYLGIPGGGNASPFTWDHYERATGVYAPMVPAGSAFPLVPDDPALWPIKYPLITHDVGRTNDRSTAVVGGYSPLVPNELVVKEIAELPQGLFGHQLAGALVEFDARYQHNAVIVPDLSNDASYAEVLCEVFGKRVVGVQIGAAGDGTTIETRILKNGYVRVYRLGDVDLQSVPGLGIPLSVSRLSGISALGQKQTSRPEISMSALPPKADIRQRGRHVRFVPKTDLTPDHPRCSKRAVFHVLG